MTSSLAGERPAHHRDEVLGAIEADVTAEVASRGTFGVRDDLELPEREAKKPARDRVVMRRQMPGLRSKRRRPASPEPEKSSRPPRLRSTPCVSDAAARIAAETGT